MQLRDYQQEMLDRLHHAWEKQPSVMVQMPTGVGKTHLMAETIRCQLKIDNGQLTIGGENRVLVVAHRIELIEQISRTLDRFGIEHGLIVSGKPVDETKSVQVANIQTLSRRIGHTDNNNSSLLTLNFSLIIIDEAHHAVAKTYRLLWDRWLEAKYLGLTATPCRMNNTSFTDLFDTLLQSYPIQEFIDRGWLSDFEYVSAAPDNKMVQQVRELKKRGVGGDYQEKEMCAVLDVPESIEHLYCTYEAFAGGKKGIVYAINREHARHIAEHYRMKGVRCAVIDSKTPEKEREQIVENYRQHALDVLVNVDIFGEGFDVPEVEFIQLARPTLSLSKYLQQVGRGMRISENKDAVLILDQVGLYQIFGLPTDEHDWEQLFHGKLAGKGNQVDTKGIVIRDDLDDKLLVNLEMVRIKRRGEAHNGLEIFLKDGKYGIMNDGHVTCQPELEKVTRLEAPYFAMGTYPYYIFRNRLALIDMKGCDMKPGLYGNVKKEGDVFIGKDITGRTDYWDAKGGRHYHDKPTFDRIERFEVAKVGEQVYMRQDSKQWEEPIDMNSIYVHDVFLIIGNMLIFRNDISKAYEICGYENGGIHIKYQWRYDKTYPYACISRFGDIFSYEKTLPSKLSPRPVNMDKMGMRRYSKKAT